MLGLRILAVVVALMVLVGACEETPQAEATTDQDAPSPGTATAQSTAMPAPDANAVWAYIAETQPYTQWQPWPGKPDMYPGQSPHGAYLKLYVNPAAMQALQAGNTTMPDRAILVKENYAADQSTLVAITPMYKIDGYNPSAGDWFWAKYGPEGQVMTAGKVDSCIECHQKAEGDDWLFTKLQ